MLRPILGLIYKDFTVNKKISLYAIVFVVFTICICFAFGRDYPIITYAGAVMLYLAGSFVPETAMIADWESKWNIFALTLPTAAGIAILTKYIIFTGMSIVCFVLSVILAYVSAMVFGSGFSIYPLLAIFGFMVAFDSISYAFIFRFGPRRGAVFKAVFIFALPVAALMYLLFGDLTIFGENGFVDFVNWLSALDLNNIIGKAWVLLLVLAAACWAGGYAFSRKGYRPGT